MREARLEDGRPREGVRRVPASVELLRLLTRHRSLTWEMTKREISDRYAGQVLGTLWAVGHPLILICVYIFVFAFVFKARIGGTKALPLDYITYLLSGLIPFTAFNESMSKGATVIVANASIVKQVVFPIEVLPVKGALASMISQGIMTILLLLYVLASSGSLSLMALLLPVLWGTQALAMIGVSYVLSSVGAYFRDIKDFVQVSHVIGMYLVPVTYLPEWMPETLRPLLFLNPFSYMTWCYQDAVYYGRFEHPIAWVAFFAGSLLAFYGGYRIFRRLKGYFGNVL